MIIYIIIQTLKKKISNNLFLEDNSSDVRDLKYIYNSVGQLEFYKILIFYLKLIFLFFYHFNILTITINFLKIIF